MNPPHAPAMTPMIDTDSAREGKGKREKKKGTRIGEKEKRGKEEKMRKEREGKKKKSEKVEKKR
jgi:hypothetical protein